MNGGGGGGGKEWMVSVIPELVVHQEEDRWTFRSTIPGMTRERVIEEMRAALARLDHKRAIMAMALEGLIRCG